MKRRVRKIVNFFAFNLLFFALYLNFIHKEPNSAFMGGNTVVKPATAFGVEAQEIQQIAEKTTNNEGKLAVN